MKVMGALAIISLVAFLALGYWGVTTVGGFLESIGEGLSNVGDTITALPQKVTDSVSAALKNEVRANFELRDRFAQSVKFMGNLETASNPVDAKVKVGIEAGLFNLCGASVDHAVEGTIEAGVDLSQVQGSDFSHDLFTNSWTLRLGPAQVTGCRIDYIRQTGHSRSICGQDWDEYRLLAETVVLPEFRNLALAEGLLAQAEQEAQLVLGNFLRAVTGSENITIVFQSDPVTEYPESCLREPPRGWIFDEESDTWKRE